MTLNLISAEIAKRVVAGARLRAMSLSALLALAACSKTKSTPPAPVTAAEARTLAIEFQQRMLPCNAERLDALVDRDAFAKRVGESAPDGEAAMAFIDQVVGGSAVTKLCAWMSGVTAYRFLDVRTVDGEFRPVLRRSTGVTLSYHELLPTRSADDKVRVADVYSYYKAGWVSDEFAGLLRTAQRNASDLRTGQLIQRAQELQDTDPAAALRALDQLPPKVRALRSSRTWRVKIAQKISMEAFANELDAVAASAPNDPGIALLRTDADFLRGDYDAAIRDFDIVEAAVRDPYLGAGRALVLLTRNKAGDLERAEREGQAAVNAEPDMILGYLALAAAAATRRDWKLALQRIDEIRRRFPELAFDETQVALFAELLATPEYAAWRDGR